MSASRHARQHKRHHQPPPQQQHQHQQLQQKDEKEPEDIRSMSPTCRRRYQSKMSSARLRERQKQRIKDVERDIEELERTVEDLENEIARYKDRPTLDNNDTSKSPASSHDQHQHQEQDGGLLPIKNLVSQVTSAISQGGGNGGGQLKGVIDAVSDKLVWLESSIQSARKLRQDIYDRTKDLEEQMAKSDKSPSRISISFLTGDP